MYVSGASALYVVLLLGVQAAHAFSSAVTSSSEPSALSAQPGAAGACCVGGTCKNRLSINSCKGKGRWHEGTTCAADTCARGTCCFVSSALNYDTCASTTTSLAPDPVGVAHCYKDECPEYTDFSNKTQSNVFVIGATNKSVCKSLKGACCIRKTDGSRVCKQTGYEQCQAEDGFLEFSYNKTCAEARCRSQSYGGCCLLINADDPSGQGSELCLIGWNPQACNDQLGGDFAPTQACRRKEVPGSKDLVGYPLYKSSCGNFTGACCSVNTAGDPICDDTLNMSQCMALPGFLGFDYSKKCSESTCAKFGACCIVESLTKGKPLGCLASNSAKNCNNQSGFATVFIPGAPCSLNNNKACQGSLVGACCAGGAHGASTCQSNVEFKDCTYQHKHLAFTYEKDCQKDNIVCEPRDWHPVPRGRG